MNLFIIRYRMQTGQQAYQAQRAVSEAISLYINRQGRHEESSSLAPDLKALQQAGAERFPEILKSNLTTGLSTEQAKLNGEKLGRNVYAKRKTKTLWQIFLEALCDDMLIILMIAAVISIVVEFFFGEEKEKFWVEGVSILVAVLICSTVATVSNYQKERQFQDLDNMTEETYNYMILRDGKRQEIHRNDIVPGDIIQIENGLEVPADSIVVKAINVVMNESSLTGESHEMYKNTYEKCVELSRKMNHDPSCPTPIMVSGSTVSSGEGYMMAVVVGKDSRMGQSFELLLNDDEEDSENKTPLERQLEDLADQIGKFALYSAGFIFFILIVRLIIQNATTDGFHFGQDMGKIVSYLIIAVTIVVVAIPEGLPLAVTLTLAYSMKEMHHEKILVRNLASCETMGAAHFLCTDKTGTLTQNKMKVTKIMLQKIMDEEDFNSQKLSSKYTSILSKAIYHNSSAYTDPQKGPQTEIALLKVANKLSGGTELVVRDANNEYFKRIPFNSIRKRLTTGLTEGGKNYVFTSGASERIIEACNTLMDSSGNTRSLDKQAMKNGLEKMALEGLRTVGIGYKQVPSNRVSLISRESEVSIRKSSMNSMSSIKDGIEDIEKSEFILLGIFGIEDTARPESQGAVERCKNAGIQVVMVTGDNRITAQKIAENVSIFEPGNKVKEGSEFVKELERMGLLGEDTEESDKSNQDEKSVKKAPNEERGRKKIKLDTPEKVQDFKKIVEGLTVMARSQPEHKYLLVDGLNKLGNIVGVTGDGANDAPALKRANIGLAMGITGTQVAKNASDIIVLDDRFDSIVRAVVWGRNVYVSVRKFLQFQLTVNVVAVFLSALSAALIRQSVLTAVQMLWVNLIMDSLAALALATEPPNEPELLSQKPNSPDEPLVTKTMLKHIIGQSFFQMTVLVLLLFLGPQFLPEASDAFDAEIGGDLSAKYYRGVAEGTMTEGTFYTIGGASLYKEHFDKYHVYSRHITFIFNTFVFMQVFNFFCCRRINDELNILSRICSSYLFWIIVGVIILFQFVVVEYLCEFFQLYKYGGLNLTQWILSVGIAAATIPFSIVLRLLPFWKPRQEEEGSVQR